MMIERLSGINPLQNVQRSQQVSKKAEVSTFEDTVVVSDEAKRLAEEYMLSEIAAQTPDIREDLVAQVKEKIKDPNYINAALLNSVADKFLESVGI
ncbi:MAG: flagellar biosynthesis anti-sigma factor FlgM [Treponemataceae bacterium]|nr:flagellar biosynthesis anti-sigma factor FlgM [Spirochaetales bacterium]MDY6030485.1 flagellar biosynthesis anti-sigma factor FlgM [Treponemataceae bacterium]